MTKTEFEILFVLHRHGDIHGTEKLMEKIGVRDLRHKPRVTSAADLLAKNEYIEIERSLGGRGNKTVYRIAPMGSKLFQVQR